MDDDEIGSMGMAAYIVVGALIRALVTTGALSVANARQALDQALLALERGQGDAPVPAVVAAARRDVERILAQLR